MTTETITGSSWQRALPAARKRRTQQADLRHAHFAEVRHRLEGNRLLVFNVLCGMGEGTGSEIAHRIGWQVTSVRPRLVDLVNMDRIELTGERRSNGNGGKEHVYRVVKAERQGELGL